MKLFLSHIFLFVSLWCFGQVDSIGVVTNATDTVKHKKPSTKNDTWFYSSVPDQHTVIDSTILHFEEYNVVQRDGIEYLNMGNTGSAAYPTVYSIDKHMGFNTGYNQYDIYKYQRDSIKHYQVIRPYTEVSLMFGLNKESVITAKFANQHKKLIYYGVCGSLGGVF